MDNFPPLDCSSAVINQHGDEDDEWVVVKKQRITILIPPPSIPTRQMDEEKRLSPTGQPNGDERDGSRSRKRGRDKRVVSVPAKCRVKPVIRRGYNIKPRVDCSDRPHLVGGNRDWLQHKQLKPSPSRGGAANIINRQIRATNLGRKLRSLGGTRRWMSEIGLGRFAAVFDGDRMGDYQMANLSSGKLKGMGMNAVGHRRKLMHAIDLFSQPYYKLRV